MASNSSATPVAAAAAPVAAPAANPAADAPSAAVAAAPTSTAFQSASLYVGDLHNEVTEVSRIQ